MPERRTTSFSVRRVDHRKIAQFLMLTYLISWSAAAALWLIGVEYGSIASLVVLAVFFMPGPAYATLIVTKVLRKEKLAEYGARLPGTSWRWFIITAIAIPVVIVAACFAIVALVPIEALGQIDFSREGFVGRVKAIAPQAEMTAEALPIDPIFIFILGCVQGILAGGTINAVFAFGEELGWRGLMLRETQRLGFWKSNALIGLVWGFWHAPVILMGHNYGKAHAIAGVFVMTAFTIAMAFPLAYSRVKSGNVFAPSVFHGIINAIGGLTVVFISGANPLVGHIAGAAGIAAALLLTTAIVLFDRRFVTNYVTTA
jgi:membrane protease YdiL (CAAX protease family)